MEHPCRGRVAQGLLPEQNEIRETGPSYRRSYQNHGSAAHVTWSHAARV
jgi:hypothetical protein